MDLDKSDLFICMWDDLSVREAISPWTLWSKIKKYFQNTDQSGEALEDVWIKIRCVMDQRGGCCETVETVDKLCCNLPKISFILKRL